MSGEAGGIVIGGMLALAVAPVVIAGAATAGIAYGALKIGGYLGKHAIDYAIERKREKELVVNQCSTELSAMYSKMQTIVREETDAHVEYANKLSSAFSQMGNQLQSFKETNPSIDSFETRIAASREMIAKSLDEDCNTIHATILNQGKENLSKCIEVLESQHQKKEELVQWASTTITAISMQKSISQEMLRDATASYKLLESMANSSFDSSFRNKVISIQQILNRAIDAFNMGMYQSAFSSARTVIRNSAMIAAEHVQDEMECDLLEMEYRAKIEGLREELKARRRFEFCDGTRNDGKKVKVDLNNFSQGKYKEMQLKLDLLLTELDSQSKNGITSYEFQKLNNQFNKEVQPEAIRIIDKSIKVMAGYYERLHVLEVVADFMVEQGYQMDWAMPVGGDASQKLVVHFAQKITGNTVSVTLDNDIEAGDIANMAMEVLTFYDNGREVSERQKQELRDHLTQALNKAGLSGSLSCQGHVNESSDQVELNEKASVKALPVKPII